VEWREINRNTEGEDIGPERTDAEAWRLEEQTRLDTLVVQAVNDDSKMRKKRRREIDKQSTWVLRSQD